MSQDSIFGPGTDLDFDASTGSMEPSFKCRRLTSEYAAKCIGQIESVAHSPEESLFEEAPGQPQDGDGGSGSGSGK